MYKVEEVLLKSSFDLFFWIPKSMKKNILIFTDTNNDEHMLSVISYIDKYKYNIYSIESTKLCEEENRFLLYSDNSIDKLFILNNMVPDISQFHAIWLRRLTVSIHSDQTMSAERKEWLAGETRHGLTGSLMSLYACRPATQRWINSPSANLLSEHKLYQLQLAKKYWKIPKTYYTNSQKLLWRLIPKDSGNSEYITKSIFRGFFIENNEVRVIYTNNITDQLLAENHDKDIDNYPSLIQESITKKFEVRATVVADKVYAVAIHSQESLTTKIDWRRYDLPNTPHEFIQLPQSIEQACIQYCKELGLIYGAIDFIVDKNDSYWFLEINPKGQWLWLEDLTGAPISKAIAEYLCG